MLNTYIKNSGTTKTIIFDNNHKDVNQLNWDADYNGDIANISINTKSNGKSKHFDIKLDNYDLANLLNIQSVNAHIDKRLKMDFNKPGYIEPYFVELPTQKTEPLINEPETTMEELIDRHISSPKSNEFFLPLTINSKAMDKYTLTPKKTHKHKRGKKHITHKVIKKTKSSRKSPRTKSSSRTSKNKNSRISL